MDVINLISKDQSFPDADETITIKPPKSGKEGQTKYHPGWKWYINGPRMHEFHQELKREVLEPYKAITVGEMPRVSDADEVLKTVGQRDGNLKMMFIFDVVDVDNVPGQGRLALNEWTLRDIVKPIEKWQRLMTERDGWNSVFIENHDNPRSVSRYCDDADEWREKGAKLLALMQTTLSGTIFVYQGEEIGMRNMPKGWGVEEYKDIESVNFWKKSLELYGGDDDDEEGLREARKVLDLKARDHARTPMQWDDSPHAGFCGGEAEPWMRVMDDYPTVNVEVQMQADGGDDLSVWRFWQRGLANRKEHADAFVHGEYQTVEGAEGGSVFAYLKTGEESGKWLIVLNFSGWDVDWSLPEELQLQGWMAGNYVRGKPDKPTKGVVSLRSWEGLLGKCTS